MTKPSQRTAPDLQRAQAEFYLRQAVERQSSGEIDAAIDLYERSLGLYPTAEAYTYLGWACSLRGQVQMAIAHCLKAIALDPEFGNPYNDVGAYLIEQGELDAAIPYLKKAITARRYDAYHFPHYNLGRVYLKKGQVQAALTEFARSLEHDPSYTLAHQALQALRESMN